MLGESLRTALEVAIGEASGEPFSIADAGEAGGGSISRAFVLSDGRRRFFVKLNASSLAPMFAAEADGLVALSCCDDIRVPRVVASGESGDTAFLVLEHIELHPLRTPADGITAGRALAALHRNVGSRHGWRTDNFIGRNPQANTEHVTWPFFFSQRRLLPQLEMARSRDDCRQMILRGERLAERLAALFVDYQPRPSLLHGDLWHGNAAIDESGRFALFDPAVFHGDRDADLAMSELFGGFPESFYVAYREAFPPANGYEQRKTLYNLYHVLNHLNLFGGGYRRQAERMIESLLAEV